MISDAADTRGLFLVMDLIDAATLLGNGGHALGEPASADPER